MRVVWLFAVLAVFFCEGTENVASARSNQLVRELGRTSSGVSNAREAAKHKQRKQSMKETILDVLAKKFATKTKPTTDSKEKVRRSYAKALLKWKAAMRDIAKLKKLSRSDDRQLLRDQILPLHDSLWNQDVAVEPVFIDIDDVANYNDISYEVSDVLDPENNDKSSEGAFELFSAANEAEAGPPDISKTTVYQPTSKSPVYHPFPPTTAHHPSRKTTVHHPSQKYTIYHPPSPTTVHRPSPGTPMYQPSPSTPVTVGLPGEMTKSTWLDMREIPVTKPMRRTTHRPTTVTTTRKQTTTSPSPTETVPLPVEGNEWSSKAQPAENSATDTSWWSSGTPPTDNKWWSADAPRTTTPTTENEWWTKKTTPVRSPPTESLSTVPPPIEEPNEAFTIPLPTVTPPNEAPPTNARPSQTLPDELMDNKWWSNEVLPVTTDEKSNEWWVQETPNIDFPPIEVAPKEIPPIEIRPIEDPPTEAPPTETLPNDFFGAEENFPREISVPESTPIENSEPAIPSLLTMDLPHTRLPAPSRFIGLKRGRRPAGLSRSRNSFKRKRLPQTPNQVKVSATNDRVELPAVTNQRTNYRNGGSRIPLDSVEEVPEVAELDRLIPQIIADATPVEGGSDYADELSFHNNNRSPKLQFFTDDQFASSKFDQNAFSNPIVLVEGGRRPLTFGVRNRLPISIIDTTQQFMPSTNIALEEVTQPPTTTTPKPTTTTSTTTTTTTTTTSTTTTTTTPTTTTTTTTTTTPPPPPPPTPAPSTMTPVRIDFQHLWTTASPRNRVHLSNSNNNFGSSTPLHPISMNLPPPDLEIASHLELDEVERLLKQKRADVERLQALAALEESKRQLEEIIQKQKQYLTFGTTERPTDLEELEKAMNELDQRATNIEGSEEIFSWRSPEQIQREMQREMHNTWSPLHRSRFVGSTNRRLGTSHRKSTKTPRTQPVYGVKGVRPAKVPRDRNRPTSRNPQLMSIHQLFQLLNDADNEITTGPSCTHFDCDFEDGSLCNFETSFDEITKHRHRKKKVKREVPFYTVRSWSNWIGQYVAQGRRIDRAPVFSTVNSHFAGVYLEGQQLGTVAIKVPLKSSFSLYFTAWEATRDMRLRVCCDELCPFSTEVGLFRGSRSWIQRVVHCPPKTKTVSFECVNSGWRKGACGIDDVVLDSVECPITKKRI